MTTYKVCSPLCMVPPINLLKMGLLHGGITFDAGEHYVRQTFRNRYHILTANGVSAMTIPVKSSGGELTTTGGMHIEYSKPWLRAHLRTLRSAYGSAPFFIHYIDKVEGLLANGATTLGDFFAQSFDTWCSLLGVELNYEVQDAYQEGAFDLDYRPKIKQPEDFPAQGNPSVYPQVFEDRFGFQPNLSVIDLLFNEGPAARYALLT